MPAHIKAKQLLFVRKLFVVTPPSDWSFSRRAGRSRLIEERDLAGDAIPLRCRRSHKRFIDTREKFSALAAKKIKSASFDQAFQHFAIRDARVEPGAKVLQGSKIASLFTLTNHGRHCAFPNVLNGSKSVANGPVAGVADPGL